MTTRNDLVQDMEDAETILLPFDGLRGALWHVLEDLIRRD